MRAIICNLYHRLATAPACRTASLRDSLAVVELSMTTTMPQVPTFNPCGTPLNTCRQLLSQGCLEFADAETLSFELGDGCRRVRIDGGVTFGFVAGLLPYLQDFELALLAKAGIENALPRRDRQYLERAWTELSRSRGDDIEWITATLPREGMAGLLRLLEPVIARQRTASASRTTAPSGIAGSPLQFREEDGAYFIVDNGREVGLDREYFAFLKCLASAPNSWLATGDIRNREPFFEDYERLDRLLKKWKNDRLPYARLIDAQRGKGFRLRLT